MSAFFRGDPVKEPHMWEKAGLGSGKLGGCRSQRNSGLVVGCDLKQHNSMPLTQDPQK